MADVLQKQWRWADAEAEYRRALELSPNNADAHASFASWLLCQGRTDEALATVRRGRELDPLAVSGEDIAWILFQSHRYDEAIRELRAVLAVRPNDAGALTTLGFVLVADNLPGDAILPLEKVVSVSNGSPAATGVLIRAYAHAGRRTDALRLLAELKKRKQAGYVPAGAFVNAYLGLGDNDQAFVWLEQAYKEQSNILQFVKVHPYFDPIRSSDPNGPQYVGMTSGRLAIRIAIRPLPVGRQTGNYAVVVAQSPSRYTPVAWVYECRAAHAGVRSGRRWIGRSANPGRTAAK